MSRATADAPLTNRAARARLAARHEPYWKGIEGGVALGYRKGALGGVWMARLLFDGTYRKTTLGKSDDAVAADGVGVLDFRQAQTKATAWAARTRRVAEGLEAEPAKRAKPYTVAEAVFDYLADYIARGGKAEKDTRTKADAHIIPALGELPLGRVTRDKLKAWHRDLATATARRGAKAAGDDDGDAKRARRATANRLLALLKAVLNFAAREGKVPGGDGAWRGVQPFKAVDAATVRYLMDDEIARLVAACPADFREIVSAALFTGCRYGELAALRANDFDAIAETVHIRVSKGGKPRDVHLSSEATTFFTRMTADKIGRTLIFQRDHMTKQATKDELAMVKRAAWGTSHQFRPMLAACEAAEIIPAISFHILRHTYASRLARAGTSMPVIAAQLGHAGTRMTELHYAHMAPSYVRDTVRANFTSMNIERTDVVVSIKKIS